VTPAEARHLAGIRAELSRLARYDDESIVHEVWIRQRYDLGVAASYGPARTAAVRTAWHEAGHVVAALRVGARFSSASIRHGLDSQGRVHGVASGGQETFVIDAAGQIAERLRDWSMLTDDDQLRAWLRAWRDDGGDARRFRRGMRSVFGDDEVGAWRYCEQVLTPLRLRIRQVARALLVYPRYLPYRVAAAVADEVPLLRVYGSVFTAWYQAGKPTSESRTTSAPARARSSASNEPVATPTARAPACTAAAMSGGLSPT
jgi:hypothetical protein